MAIVIFYRRETAYSDLFFLAALFLTHHPHNILAIKRSSICIKHHPDSCDCDCIQTEEVSHNSMRYLPMLSLCAMGSMVLSPLMASLWAETGSGNANFSFFQSLFLSLISAVAIAEFAHQVTTEMDGDG
jgi:GPI transamidase subunit PIG-U